MKNNILLFAILAILTFKNQAQTVTDVDGNVYNTVIIGGQKWMKENLKVTRYRNGVSIPNLTSPASWTNNTIGARCYYNNDSSANASVYGALYNWYAANDSNEICPSGWHVPTNTEWNIMEKYIDPTVDTTAFGLTGTDFGGKLKETGITHWTTPNTGATNSSGFSALPGGYRYIYASYTDIGNYGYWWSATSYDSTGAWDRLLSYDNSQVYRYYHDTRLSGFSIRCICDKETDIYETPYHGKIEIFPNPALSKINIVITEKQIVTAQIYNMIGEQISKTILINGTTIIDIGYLSKGIYIIKLTCDNWNEQQKIIKE
ncbi:MAG TPA: FISUMP domain-containing protein [Bacteroidales bacterium]|nr:FISUMP domain-containing protein [Bacteroidales bacterium]